MTWEQNLVILVCIKLLIRDLKILNHRILIMEYCLTDKAYVQYRKETLPFCQKFYLKICYSELLFPNLRMLNAPYDVQVSVLEAWDR